MSPPRLALSWHASTGKRVTQSLCVASQNVSIKKIYCLFNYQSKSTIQFIPVIEHVFAPLISSLLIILINSHSITSTIPSTGIVFVPFFSFLSQIEFFFFLCKYMCCVARKGLPPNTGRKVSKTERIFLSSFPPFLFLFFLYTASRKVCFYFSKSKRVVCFPFERKELFFKTKEPQFLRFHSSDEHLHLVRSCVSFFFVSPTPNFNASTKTKRG